MRSHDGSHEWWNWMLPGPYNQFMITSYPDDTDGYAYKGYSLQDAVETITGDNFDNFSEIVGEGLSDLSFTDGSYAGGYGRQGMTSTIYESGEFHDSETPKEGYEVIGRLALTATENNDLHAFFPNASKDWTETNGEAFIVKMLTDRIPYQVPLDNYNGYLSSAWWFAWSQKMRFYSVTSATTKSDMQAASAGFEDINYSLINPCPDCQTIGRAINEWERMSSFYYGYGGAGVYDYFAAEAGFLTNVSQGIQGIDQARADGSASAGSGFVGTATYQDTVDSYMDSESILRTTQDVLLASDALAPIAAAYGVVDASGIDTLRWESEINTNTYGSAYWTSLRSQRQFFGILTKFTGVSDSDNVMPDFFNISFFQTHARQRVLGYSGDVHRGGYEGRSSETRETSTSDAAITSTLHGNHIDAITDNTDPKRSTVPYTPYIKSYDYSKSAEVTAELFGTTDVTNWGEGSITTEETYGMYHLHTSTGVIVDLINRFGATNSSYKGSTTGVSADASVMTMRDRMSYLGAIDKSKGFLANKAWLLQISLDAWTGNMENKINQQLSPTLDIKMMNPVGDIYGGYTATEASSMPADSSMMGDSGDSSGGSYGSY
tara:strand:+ start:51286 stop:53100 length:1815 start_codon:yes stop_codon:yes gene_type:complete